MALGDLKKKSKSEQQDVAIPVIWQLN